MKARPRRSERKSSAAPKAQAQPSPPPMIRGLETTAYTALAFAVLCQGMALAITWPVWQIRSDPAALPVLPLPAISFGLLVALSLILCLWLPRVGAATHAILFFISCIFDQYRLQPQFLGVVVLIVACAFSAARPLGRWYLASLWLWAGLHKLLSPAWFGPTSWILLDAAGLEPERLHLAFAVVVPVSEVAAAILAIWRPRIAAWACLALHLGIVVFLSPAFYSRNASVIPWNLAVAFVGLWLLRTVAARGVKPSRNEAILAAALFVAPSGYYLGLIDRALAHVLYTDVLPRAAITQADGAVDIPLWGKLAVPFPASHGCFLAHFRRVATPGDRLHIDDPRRAVDDGYYELNDRRQAAPLSRAEFLRAGAAGFAGCERDRATDIFRLLRAKVRLLKKSDHGMIYAAKFSPDWFRREQLHALNGLPGLQELQLGGCAVGDADLALLPSIKKLEGVGLSCTPITDAGMKHVRRISHLTVLELSETAIGDEGVRELKGCSTLKLLDLRQTRVTDQSVATLLRLPNLERLSLQGTRLSTEGVARLRIALPETIVEFEEINEASP